ncbi:signal peptidase I [Phenylobacterium sp.]|uniref:signal peptidase I n=1 Tax=Phenylobacterium sp. TaxID=1871053 RepID=UPI003BAD52A2
MSAKPSPRDEWIEIVRTVAYALLIALVLRVGLFQPFTIPSASMEPALRQGDYVIVSKFDYGWSRYSIPFGPPLPAGRLFGKAPARGDVVVFKLPREPKIDYIKRVVGLPGDRIRISGGAVFVNGKALPRKPLAPGQDTAGVPVARDLETQASGRAYVTYDQGPGHQGDDTETYVVPQGRYFMMGDNRDNSLDSRWPAELGVGLVPADNLVGHARMILVSWRPGASILKPWTWLNLDLSRSFKAVG